MISTHIPFPLRLFGARTNSISILQLLLPGFAKMNTLNQITTAMLNPESEFSPMPSSPCLLESTIKPISKPTPTCTTEPNPLSKSLSKPSTSSIQASQPEKSPKPISTNSPSTSPVPSLKPALSTSPNLNPTIKSKTTPISESNLTSPTGSISGPVLTPKKNYEIENSNSFNLIVTSLRENSEILKKILNEIKTINDRIDYISGSSTLKSIEARIDNLHNDIRNLPKLSPPKSIESLDPTHVTHLKSETTNQIEIPETRKLSMIFRCNSWGDFLTFGCKPQTVSFTCLETDKIFEVYALKNNQIVVYTGEIPEFEQLLKTWLSSRLELLEENVFEGVLTKA